MFFRLPIILRFPVLSPDDLHSRTLTDSRDLSDPLLIDHYTSMTWCFARGVTNTCPVLDLASKVTRSSEVMMKEALEIV